jgi:aldose 1-epimerase
MGFQGKKLIGIVLAALVALTLVETRSQSPGRGAREGKAAWSEEKDQATGWTVWHLQYDDPDDARCSQSVRICPDMGANLFSYVFGGTELLHAPGTLGELTRGGGGIPVLYPTPNRVRNGRFTFEGREFVFSDEGKTTIHGLVLRSPWNSDLPVIDSSGSLPGVSVRCWIDFEPGTTQFDRFPVRHRLSLTYRLTAGGITGEFAIENHDSRALPFGVALHPYFRILGSRDQTFLRVPAKKKMEATADLLPTGKLLSLDGAPFDLRAFRPLSELNLDDVFWGMEQDQPAGYEARDAGIKVDLPASPDFTHMVVYTPGERPFFCLENQTCSTDAHNLHAHGLVAESHLLVIQPGGSWSGRIEIRPSWLPQ